MSNGSKIRSTDGPPDELPGRSPIMAIFEDGVPISICFRTRVYELVAEVGVETAPEFLGRGIAGLATVAWATTIEASGRTPIYFTSWSNGPSVAAARTLGLVARASIAKADTRTLSSKPRM